MENLNIAEKYYILACGKNGNLNVFKSLQNGLYISSFIDLCKNEILDTTATNVGYVKVAKELPENLKDIEIFYNFCKENEEKTFTKLFQKFINPFMMKKRIEMINLVKETCEIKMPQDFEIEKENLVEIIKKQLVKFEDEDSLLLAKIMVEMKIIKKYFSKEEIIKIKAMIQENKKSNATIEKIMILIESQAVAGALAGAGVY